MIILALTMQKARQLKGMLRKKTYTASRLVLSMIWYVLYTMLVVRICFSAWRFYRDHIAGGAYLYDHQAYYLINRNKKRLEGRFVVFALSTCP